MPRHHSQKREENNRNYWELKQHYPDCYPGTLAVADPGFPVGGAPTRWGGR